MNIDAYISSGILENYCLGFCSAEENASIEEHASKYPQIQHEIEKIRNSLEDYFQAKQIKPSAAIKIKVMLAVYKQMAVDDRSYAPLITSQTETSILASWIADKKIAEPTEPFENLYISELPSTDLVTNFIVYAKAGHETEIHDNFIEYLYIIKGSCTMDFEGVIKSYGEGDIIKIEKHINHTATVTSPQPMIALVQRQACA